MIPQTFIQDLLNRVDIVDVVGRTVQLKKGGANLMGLCPFHNEKSPSFTVSPAKQFYHCFGCGAHGSAIGFLMEYAGLSYVEAIKDLAQGLGLTVPDERDENAPRRDGPDAATLTALMDRAARYFREQLKAAPVAVEYLKGRGLTGQIAARYGMGYSPDEWNGLQGVFGEEYAGKPVGETGLTIDHEKGTRYDRFRGRVMFPIRSTRGAIIGFGGRVIGAGEPKYLNSPETPLFEKGRELYGLFEARQAIREAGRALVVEGYMDVVALAQHGVGYAVATLGTACTPAHVQKLTKQTDRIIFCFDGDNAGRKAAWRALENSLSLTSDDKIFSFLFLPQEHDPDTYIREYGREAFEGEEGRAKPLSVFLLEQLKSEVDLSVAEGRSGLVKAAQPHLQRISAPGLRLAIVKEIAELAEMTPREVEGLADLKPQASHLRAPPPRVARAPVTSLEKQMLWLLARLPALARSAEMEESKHYFPADTLIRRVIDVLEAHEGIDSTSAMYEFFRGSDDEPEVSDAVKRALEEKDDEMVRLEFSNALCIAGGAWCEGEMNRLIADGSAAGENAGEYRELQARKEALKQRLRST
ncbi:MAG: dnaG [Betaproteobacteria bacterium]|nr:dnaG [Betaproteobacteria bacterium]